MLKENSKVEMKGVFCHDHLVYHNNFVTYTLAERLRMEPNPAESKNQSKEERNTV